VSSGLGTNVTLAGVYREKLGEFITLDGPAYGLIFVSQYVVDFGLRFEWYLLEFDFFANCGLYGQKVNPADAAG
jgi:hypothetical protein